MVTVHNTQNYHNYIYNFNNIEFVVNKNTILDYLKNKHENIYILKIKQNNRLKNLLNKNNIQQTLFISINNNIDNLYEYLFDGNIEINNNDYFINNKNNKLFIIKDNKIQNKDIIIPNIKLGNGIIHIIN